MIPLFNINRWVEQNFGYLTWEQVQSWFVFDPQKPLFVEKSVFACRTSSNDIRQKKHESAQEHPALIRRHNKTMSDIHFDTIFD